MDVVASRHSGLVYRTLRAKGFSNLDDTGRNGVEIYKKLLAGRCDLAVSDAPLGVRHILSMLGHPVDALTQTRVKILDAQLYIAVNKNVSDEEIARWQKALDRLKASGAFGQFLKRYNG